jgi:hypothetical protein
MKLEVVVLPVSDVFGTGITSAVSGSVQDLQLTVRDIDTARAELVARGVDVTEPFHCSRR